MKTIDEIAQFFNESANFCGRVLQHEPLSRRTTMRVGGEAALFLEPADEASLLHALQVLEENGTPYFVLGGGSNVIISDEGFVRAVVISTRGLKSVLLADDGFHISVGAGASWARVQSFCRERGRGGFEPFAGLSGTVGGAVYMNATCFGFSTNDRLCSVRYFDAATTAVNEYVLTDARRLTDWGYKRSPFQVSATGNEARRIILSATFAVSLGYDAQKAAACIESRKEKGHFRAPCAGSTFKNDTANAVIAGKLIDDCGLKGFAVGGAQVAPWHGNIIINTGGATARDIRSLVEQVRNTVHERTGVFLEPEVLFCGDSASAAW